MDIDWYPILLPLKVFSGFRAQSSELQILPTKSPFLFHKEKSTFVVGLDQRPHYTGVVKGFIVVCMEKDMQVMMIIVALLTQKKVTMPL